MRAHPRAPTIDRIPVRRARPAAIDAGLDARPFTAGLPFGAPVRGDLGLGGVASEARVCGSAIEGSARIVHDDHAT